MRRVWGLPRTAHNILLPLVSCQPPLADVIAKRFVLYVQRCLASDCKIVNCITRYGVWSGRMASPVGRSAQHCGSKYGFTVDDICTVFSSRIDKHFVENIDPSVVDSARVLLELIFARNGSLCVDLPLDDIQFLISYICTM